MCGAAEGFLLDGSWDTRDDEPVFICIAMEFLGIMEQHEATI